MKSGLLMAAECASEMLSKPYLIAHQVTLRIVFCCQHSTLSLKDDYFKSTGGGFDFSGFDFIKFMIFNRFVASFNAFLFNFLICFFFGIIIG